MNKLECIHADTCLSDYWAGHRLPHCQIIVWKGITLDEIKKALKNEINEGAICGADYDPDNDQFHDLALSAIDEIQPKDPEQKTFFNDLEDSDPEYDPSVYAFFVFRGV